MSVKKNVPGIGSCDFSSKSVICDFEDLRSFQAGSPVEFHVEEDLRNPHKDSSKQFCLSRKFASANFQDAF